MLTTILICSVFYLLWLLPKSLTKLGHYSVILAWLLHAYIGFDGLFDENGWKLNIANSILMVSWLSVLIVVIFNISCNWVKVPLILFVLISFTILKFGPVMDNQQYKEFSWQMDLHISLSMLAFSVLTVSSLYAISLWFCIKRIKNPNTIASTGLVSLMDEEKKLFNMIFLGWLILTTSLISGDIFIDDFVHQHLGHKVVFSILAWIIFGILILKRLSKGFRGEKLITLTITGTGLLFTGYLGSKIVLEWLLQK